MLGTGVEGRVILVHILRKCGGRFMNCFRMLQLREYRQGLVTLVFMLKFCIRLS